MARSLRTLRARRDRYVAGLPTEIGDALRAYRGDRSPGSRRHAAAGPGPDTGRDWLLLPGWLLERYGRRPHAPPPAFLADVLWAQYCVFLFVRLHDDIFDRQTQDLRLVFAADQLLIEAERVLARWFETRSPFWACMRRQILETTGAIVEVAGRQRRPGAMTIERIEAYARVSAVLRLGTAAVAYKLGRPRALAPAFRFLDEVAAVDQILDDYLDLEEDLAQGRYNVALNLLAGPTSRRTPVSPAAVLARAARSLVVRDGIRPLVQEAHRRLAAASAAIAPLRLAPAVETLARMRQAIDELDRSLLRARVDRVFAGLAGDASARRPTAARRAARAARPPG